MAKPEFSVDDGLGEVVISDPPLSLSAYRVMPSRGARALMEKGPGHPTFEGR
jgi:hypothetical protein